MDLSFYAYLQNAPPAIVLSPDILRFTIITANPAFLEATNTRLDELTGKSFFNVFPENTLVLPPKKVHSLIDCMTDAILTKQLKILASQRYDVPVWGTNRFNTRYWRTSCSPIVNESGDVQCIVLTILDVTDDVACSLKKRFVLEVAEERREATLQIEERLRLAIESAEMGTWYMDVETRGFVPLSRMKALFGFDSQEDMSYEAAIAQILPEYREIVTKSVEAALLNCIPYNMEYPIMGYHDHKIRWVRTTGKRYEAEVEGVAHFSGTIMDITERKLEEIRKNDFLSIASHELKTPLTSLKASLQLLSRMKDNPTAAMLPKLINQSNRSIDKISNLVNDLLNVGRITENQFELNKSVFSISRLIDGCCDHVTSVGTHQLLLEGDQDLKVCGDEHHIDQVLVNLVNNAVKYAHGSFKITLRIESEYPMAKISVQDFGPGIPKNHLDQLFKRYYRADTTSIQNSGLGLGLYISTEIVKKHGGQIGVISELGKGSTFWFTIPLAEFQNDGNTNVLA